MDELRANLVIHRYDVQTAIRAFHGVLSVLRVIVDASMSEQIALIVGIRELLCTEHIQILCTKAWVEREENVLGDVHGVLLGDGIRQFEVVAFLSSDGTCSNLLLGDGIEAVEEVERRITVRITHTCPDSLIEVFRETFCYECQDMQGSGSLHLSVALCVTNLSEQCRNRTVRFKFRYYATQECFEGAEVDIQIEVRGARRLVRTELRISRQCAHLFLVADARSCCHVLESFLNTDDGKHQKVGAPFGCRLLIVLQCKCQFSSHNGMSC